MELLYVDEDIVVCLKPARVLSTDEPGGVPDLVREIPRLTFELFIGWIGWFPA